MVRWNTPAILLWKLWVDFSIGLERARSERVVIHREIPGQIDRVRCFSAVGWALPGRAAAPKGGGVHPSKSHLSWVKYGASQYGLYLLKVRIA